MNGNVKNFLKNLSKPKKCLWTLGDVTVAWMDHNSGKGYAEDYYLDAKSQCAGSRGSCPDSNIPLGILAITFMEF